MMAAMRTAVLFTFAAAACSSEGLPSGPLPDEAQPTGQVDLTHPTVDIGDPPPLDLSVPPGVVDLAPFTPTGCIGHPFNPPPTRPVFKFPIHVFDYLSKQSVPGAVVKVCMRIDLDCVMPFYAGQTDGNGLAYVAAPSGPEGLDGYLDITATNFAETLAFHNVNNPDLVFNGSTPIETPIFAQSTISLVNAILGVQQDKTRGEIAFTIEDCSYSRGLPGAMLSSGNSDARTQTFYVSGSLPAKNATQTDSSGAGFVTNALPGSDGAAVWMPSLMLNISGGNFVVRAGTVTTVTFPPNA